MFSRIATVLFLVVVATSLVLAGTGQTKAPYRVTGQETAPLIGTTDGSLPPMVSALGPGDSIAYTYYDYATNGGARRELVNLGDGTMFFGNMGSLDGGVTGWASRGSYTKCYDGSAWASDWDQVELTRRGWTNVAMLADAGNIGVVLSHVGMEVNVDAAFCAETWTSSITGGVGQTWPRLAIGSGFTIHVINAGDAEVEYGYSPDAGTTWIMDIINRTEPGVVTDADAYDLTAQGDKVAYVIAGAGGDVAVYESMDGGATWTETLIYDIDESGFTAGEEPSDGSPSIIYDSNGNLHAAWGSYLFDGSGAFVTSRDAGIRHWSMASGVQEIAWANPDTNIVDPGGRDGNYATQPDLCADSDGNVFIVYSTFVPEVDDSGNYYEHSFGIGSADGGMTWSGSLDLTPGTGFDASFPAAADLVDDYVHFVYYCDPLAGNALQGNHGDLEVAFMYHMVDKMEILNTVDVKEITDGVPAAYQLQQNYPNPFNPSTQIHYSIPQSSFVTLKVYDMLGREVATLVNGEQAAGTYSAAFNAENLANGTYIYRLQAGDFTESRKMLLLK